MTRCATAIRSGSRWWAAAFFRAFDSPAPVDAISVLCVVAGAAALAGFARLRGLGSGPARLAAGLFLLAPVHLLNAPSGYVDAAFSGCLVALFVAVARWTAPDRAGSAPGLDTGIAAALVIALKPHGFAFAAVALASGLWLRARALGARRASREFIAIAALASPGLFFAARNLMRTGNPLYPLELRLGEHVLLHGESSLDGILTPTFNVPRELAALPAWLRPVWVWLQPHGPARSFDDRWAGFGYAFAALGLPALLWAVSRREARAALGVVLGLSFVCWLLQPLSFWPRFSSWLWGAAALAVAFGIGELARRGRMHGAQLALASALLLSLPEGRVRVGPRQSAGSTRLDVPVSGRLGDRARARCRGRRRLRAARPGRQARRVSHAVDARARTTPTSTASWRSSRRARACT